METTAECSATEGFRPGSSPEAVDAAIGDVEKNGVARPYRTEARYDIGVGLLPIYRCSAVDAVSKADFEVFLSH